MEASCKRRLDVRIKLLSFELKERRREAWKLTRQDFVDALCEAGVQPFPVVAIIIVRGPGVVDTKAASIL